ncbi:hypothetical protein [Maridesulfovibrio sp.]|jgi:hypothetical protein|uniref:hypothetical protein n=1 Tax=Maridesulfovibrio sp. TaxID=2795000 RepID=UPI0029CA25BC|nr:hypothetical protein [Maridesulfovibrio sp.]
MMANVQTAKDVIEQTKAFHAKLGSFYKELSDKAEKERVKLLLDYMSRHHDRLAAIMNQSESDISAHILNTWFMYVHKECDLSPFFSAEIGPDMTTKEVMEISIDLDKCLLETYEAMVQNDIPEDVREVFQGLLDMEKRENMKLTKNALRIETL